MDTNSGLCRLRQRSLEYLCSCKVQHYTICQLFETKSKPSAKTRAFTNVFFTITILLPPFFWNLVANINLICFEILFVSQVFVSQQVTDSLNIISTCKTVRLRISLWNVFKHWLYQLSPCRRVWIWICPILLKKRPELTEVSVLLHNFCMHFAKCTATDWLLWAHIRQIFVDIFVSGFLVFLVFYENCARSLERYHVSLYLVSYILSHIKLAHVSHKFHACLISGVLYSFLFGF